METTDGAARPAALRLDREADRAAVDRRLEQVCTAWERADAGAFAAAFTPDATYTTWIGDRYLGREQIGSAHAALWAGPLRGTRLDCRVDAVRFVAPGVAVVESRGDTVRSGRGRRRPGKLQTWVLVRDGDGWRVAAFVNVRRKRLRRP